VRYIRFWGWPLLLLAASTGAVVGVLAAVGQLGDAVHGCIDVGKGTCNANWIYNVVFPALVLTAIGLGALWRLDQWPARSHRSAEAEDVP
jgi:hypothetical protein